MSYKNKTIEEITHLAEQAGLALVIADPANPGKTYVASTKSVNMDVSNNGQETVVLIRHGGND